VPRIRSVLVSRTVIVTWRAGFPLASRVPRLERKAKPSVTSSKTNCTLPLTHSAPHTPVPCYSHCSIRPANCPPMAASSNHSYTAMDWPPRAYHSVPIRSVHCSNLEATNPTRTSCHCCLAGVGKATRSFEAVRSATTSRCCRAIHW
jgi:hypothetical protein